MGMRGQPKYSNQFFEPRSEALEHIVLANSKQFYNNMPKYSSGNGRAANNWNALGAKIAENNRLIKKSEKIEEEEEGGDDSSCCNKKYCWWSPNQNSLWVAFCNETSIHGVTFLGQPKRHITERIFWLISFLFSLALCIYLIYGVWDRYQSVPVIVSFQASEQDIDSLPFPAVTLCNMNKFPKTKVERIQRIARLQYHPDYHKAKQQLKFIKSACNAQQSFAKEHFFAFQRGEVADDDNGTISEDNQGALIDFLIEVRDKVLF